MILATDLRLGNFVFFNEKVITVDSVLGINAIGSYFTDCHTIESKKNRRHTLNSRMAIEGRD